jgi:RNA polymerase sigma-70 factor (ECF subfamily)
MDSLRTASEMAGGDQVERWFDLYVDAIQQYVARRLGSDLAQDVVADTFRVAMEQIDSFDSRRGDARAWLFGIATNLIRRHWRSEQRRLSAYSSALGQSVPVVDALDAADARLDASKQVSTLVAAVAALDPGDLDVLVLTAWEDMTSSEIAVVLDIPPGTVRSRLNRVRNHLRAAAADDFQSIQGATHER